MLFDVIRCSLMFFDAIFRALRAADIGVSLNDATASVAAPFTARNKSVQGCVDILREGNYIW